jgi:SAM-dependent methyltransferase
VRVNIGCGATPTDGWTNLDNSFTVRVARWPMLVRVLSKLGIIDGQSREFAQVANRENIRFANASLHIPYADNSVEVVYSSHMVEHLDRQEARAFLLEVRRILQPGGIIRLAVPDLALLVKEYLETGDADQLIDRTHMSQGRARGPFPRLKAALIGPRRHLWMYDGRSLSMLLSNAGFIDASIMPAGTTSIEKPGHLDLAERARESVYVEAIRPRD